MSPLRRRMTGLSPPDSASLPRQASTMYVWPTLQCQVGCEHCNFAAPTRLPDEQARVVATRAVATADFVASTNAERVSVSGGGEPLEEPEFLTRFIQRLAANSDADVEVITSGYSPRLERPEELLTDWWQAWRGAGASRRFFLRLSVDWFHRQAVGVDVAASWIRAAEQHRWLTVYVRSVLLDGDSTMQELADALGGQLSPLDDYVQHLLLPTGLRIPVYYKNLILDGRMSERVLQRHGLQLTEQSRIERFQERFRDEQGRLRPGRLYNGMLPVQLEGLATVVEADGRLEILESTSPDITANIFSQTWPESLDAFYRDPVTHLLLERGTEGLLDVLERLDVEADERATARNQMYYVVPRLLAQQDVLDLATCGAVLELPDRFPRQAVELALAHLGAYGRR